jgi:ABC-type uncharacterized transport system permease subunit
MVGFNPDAARAFKIQVEKRILMSMFLSGGIAGIASSEICGLQLRLKSGFSTGFSYMGLVAALLGNLDF